LREQGMKAAGDTAGLDGRAAVNWQSAHNAVCQFTATHWWQLCFGVGDSER